MAETAPSLSKPSGLSILYPEQIEDSLRHVPTAVLGGLLNALASAAAVWQVGHHAVILGWGLAVLVLALLRYAHSSHHARSDYARIDTRRDGLVLEALSLAYGLTWGAGIALAGMVVSPGQFCLVALLSGGMMGAAVLSFNATARGAVLFMTPVALGSMIAWWVFPYADVRVGSLFSMTYLMLLSRGTLERQQEFITRIKDRDALRDTAATVQLLLNDFEAQASDWLWEVDGEGRIVVANERFAEAAGRPAAALDGTALAELFDASHERRQLEHYLSAAHPFRDLTLTLTLAGQTHWWSLSARPHGEAPRTMRGVASDVTAQKRAEARVNHMAHYDGLTNLANRRLFNEKLGTALSQRRNSDVDVALLYLDLDRFKSVNDTLGHPIGDKLLCEVARRIESAVRKSDLVARLGGDEFALMLRGTNLRAVAEVAAQRIIEAVREPCQLDGMQVLTSTSVGIAVAEAGSCDAATLMKRSDLALYSAKAKGRNRFAHFEPGMDEAARERLDLEIDMRAGLSEGHFVLHYQPVVALDADCTVGYEALVRWHHPLRGVIYPGQFLPLAEETGLIVQLGEWVIRQAIADLARWPEHLRVAVNLSPTQVRSANLVTTILHALAAGQVDPQRLELEVTEGTLIGDRGSNIAMLHKLRNIGLRVTLDDFGTGYSSLNYLRSFPFDKVKIDRCFIDGLGDNADSLTIVRAVIALVRSLGMVPAAEGVERPEQLEVLRAEGCIEAQGYLFSRPESADGFADLQAAAPTGGDAPVPIEANPAPPPLAAPTTRRRRRASDA